MGRTPCSTCVSPTAPDSAPTPSSTRSRNPPSLCRPRRVGPGHAFVPLREATHSPRTTPEGRLPSPQKAWCTNAGRLMADAAAVSTTAFVRSRESGVLLATFRNPVDLRNPSEHLTTKRPQMPQFEFMATPRRWLVRVVPPLNDDTVAPFIHRVAIANRVSGRDLRELLKHSDARSGCVFFLGGDSSTASSQKLNRALAGESGRMQHSYGDLTDAILRDPHALFDRERVIGGLQLDEGPLADRSGVSVGLQVGRALGIERELRAEPAEVRLLRLPALRAPDVKGTGEVFLAQRPRRPTRRRPRCR
ncbi:hypothetical protein STENM223S_09999 [Streptomyces tendae]